MRFLIVLLVIGAVVTAVVVGLLNAADDLSQIGGEPVFYGLLLLFLFPAVAAFVGAIVVAAHPRSFSYAPLAQPTKHEDPLLHAAVGLLIAILQDLSRGSLAETTMYRPELRTALQSELEEQRVYLDRGFGFHYNFHHNESYQAHLVYEISNHDLVVELDGVFDYYWERGGERHPTPHGFDKEAPLLQRPAACRLRLVREDERVSWQLAGFSESIRGLDLGLPTR